MDKRKEKQQSISTHQESFQDRAMKIIQGGYSFYAVTDPMPLRTLVKAFKPPRVVQVKNYYHSPIGTLTVGEGQILVILDAKKGKVVSGSDTGEETFKLPVTSKDIRFSPMFHHKVEMFTAKDLLSNTVLPSVVSPVRTFTDIKGKSVEAGTHLFLSKSKGTLFKHNQNIIKAQSEFGTVSISSSIDVHFTVGIKETALTLKEIDEFLSFPLSTKPVSEDDDINTIPRVNLDSIQTEEIVTALIRFADTASLPILELPASLDITACIIAPKTREELEEIYEKAETEYVNLSEWRKPVPPAIPKRCPIAQETSPPPEQGSYVYVKSQQLDLTARVSDQPHKGECRETMERSSDANPPKAPPVGPRTDLITPRYTSPPSHQAKLSTQYAGIGSMDDSSTYCEIPAHLQKPTVYMPSTPPTMPPLLPPRTVGPPLPTHSTTPPPAPQVQTQKPESTTQTEDNVKYLKSLSCEQVQQLLSAMSLSCYCEAFAKECIDGELFSSLDREMLEELGVKSKIHHLRLLKIQEGHHSAKSIVEST